MVTYRELREALNTLTPEQLDRQVSIGVFDRDDLSDITLHNLDGCYLSNDDIFHKLGDTPEEVIEDYFDGLSDQPVLVV